MTQKAEAAQSNLNPTEAEAEKADAGKERRSLDQRIDEASEALRKLQELKRKRERAQREQNEKELRELLKAEKLDEFSAATWKAALPQIRLALQNVKHH